MWLVVGEGAVEEFASAGADPAFDDRVMRGTRMPVVMVVIALSAGTVSNVLVSLLSRSRIRYRAVVAPVSWGVMMRFRACWVVQAVVGAWWCRGCGCVGWRVR